MSKHNYSDLIDGYRAAYHFDDDSLRALAHSKRYLERISGDSSFREGVVSGLYDLQSSAKACGCGIDVSTLRPIFHPEFAKYRVPDQIANWPLAARWDKYLRSLTKLRDLLRVTADTNGHNPNFDSWRRRQISRTGFELGVSGAGIVHPTVAFELSSGCSVGCWFCGISAEKFKGHFALQNGGDRIWRTILEQVEGVVGPALKGSFLYWATDPLDNPDYLGFLDIFHEVTGVFPQTTTAIPLRNLDLTKGVLDRWAHDKYVPNRFSVLNTKQLLKIHEIFTPEELIGVELVLQNYGSSSHFKANAGRTFMANKEIGGESANVKKFPVLAGTIACVSGFLINIFEKSIKLVSPCMPSDDWPNGYIIFRHEYYDSPEDLARIMERIIFEEMKPAIFSSDRVQFHKGFVYEKSATNSGFYLRSKTTKIESAVLDICGKYIAEDSMNVVDLLRMAVADGHSSLSVVHAINKAREAGLIDAYPGEGRSTQQSY